MEAIGFSLAVIGVFDQCLKGYEILAGMSAQEKSAKVLRCKLIVEERRLLSWGRAWGLMEAIQAGSMNYNNSSSSNRGMNSTSRGIQVDSPTTAASKARFRASKTKGMEWVIEEHLSSISELLSDATTLQNRYGLTSKGPDNNGGSKVSLGKKFRWAIADKEAFKELIADLRDLNDGLQTLLPEPSQAISSQALLCEMATHDVITPISNTPNGANIYHEPPSYSSAQNTLTVNSRSGGRARGNSGSGRETPPTPGLTREDSLIGILEEALDEYPHVQRCMMLRKAQVRAGDSTNEKWSPRSNLQITQWNEKITLLDYSTPTKEKDKEVMEVIRRTSAMYEESTWDDIQNKLVTNTTQVLVEWKPYEDDRDLTEERVQRLAELFHPAGGYGAFNTPDGEMRILECVGWFHDTDKQRYGLVFHMPSVPNPAASPSHTPPPPPSPSLAPPPKPSRRRSSGSSQLLLKPPTPPPAYANTSSILTLDDLLPSDSKLSKPDLGSRILLARTLSRSLLQLHAANVLHKDLCSYNVLFFSAMAVNPDDVGFVSATISHPYVSGFALARVDDASDDRTVTLASRSAARAMASTMLPYQHPAYSPALLRQVCGIASTTSLYKRVYDVYSLGCVLLEIGLWRKLRTLGWRKEYEKSAGRERWRKRLVGICDELGARCGKIYEEVVRRCLLYDEGEERREEEGDLLGFCYDILGRLEGIKV